MNRVNPATIVGVVGAQGSRERENIDRLAQSNSQLKASNAQIGKGRVQGLGPDGKTVYVTTLVERAFGDQGKMRYFANGKQLPPDITTADAARNFVREQIAKGALGQLALGHQNALIAAAPPARLRIELGYRQPAHCGALQVARSAGVAVSRDGRSLELPNNTRGGQIFARMQHTRWQRNSSQPMELIAKPVGVSAPFVQGYKAQWSQMMQRQTPTTAADNNVRAGNGSVSALSRAAAQPTRSQARASGTDAPSAQAASGLVLNDVARGAHKAPQSPRKAH